MRTDDNKPGCLEFLLTTSLVCIIAAIVALGFCSCRTTRTSVHEHHKEMSVDSSYVSHHVADSLSKYHAVVDSLSRVINRKDSVIEHFNESVVTHTGSKTDNWVFVRDSLSVSIDSTGTIAYHYWHNTDTKVVTHDTIYNERVVERDSKRVSILEDSVSHYRESYDSVMMSYVRLDSMYRALRSSEDNVMQVVEQKELSWFDRLKRDVSSLIVAIALISLITYFVVSKFKKE